MIPLGTLGLTTPETFFQSFHERSAVRIAEIQLGRLSRLDVVQLRYENR